MIDLVALRSLKAIDVHGSVVGAAQALGYSPSAISQQIKKLDKQFILDLLGIPLGPTFMWHKNTSTNHSQPWSSYEIPFPHSLMALSRIRRAA